MIWPWRRRAQPPDPEAFMAEIARARGVDVSPEQRYADFRAVFLGTEQGKRVLYHILMWGHLWIPSYVRNDPHAPHTTIYFEGQRSLALRILAAIQNEPKQRPTRAATKPKGG